MTKEIIYVIHPVSPEQKEKLSAKGRIVDARYAPEGAKILDADGKVPRKNKVDDTPPTAAE